MCEYLSLIWPCFRTASPLHHQEQVSAVPWRAWATTTASLSFPLTRTGGAGMGARLTRTAVPSNQRGAHPVRAGWANRDGWKHELLKRYVVAQISLSNDQLSPCLSKLTQMAATAPHPPEGTCALLLPVPNLSPTSHSSSNSPLNHIHLSKWYLPAPSLALRAP